MKLYFQTRLRGFEYANFLELGQSIMPSSKYQLSAPTLLVSMTLTGVQRTIEILYGLDGMGFLALVAVFCLELITGISASVIKKENISSHRLSRFTLKAACYLVLISVPYVLSQSLKSSDRGATAWALDALSSLLILQVVQENVVSVLENLAVITGKEKDSWITAIKSLFKSKIDS